MFYENYNVSEDAIRKLIYQLQNPSKEEIVKKDNLMKKFESEMIITETPDGARVEFKNLDLSFLDTENKE